MTTSAIVMMTAALVLLWGGLAVSIVLLARATSRKDNESREQLTGHVPDTAHTDPAHTGTVQPDTAHSDSNQRTDP